MTCKPYTFQGQSDCEKLLEMATALIITNKGLSSSNADFTGLLANKTIVAGTASPTGILIDIGNGVTRTTDDPTIVTTALGKKVKTQNPLPSYQAFAALSACDYDTLQGMEDQGWSIRILLNNGLIMGTKNADGTNKGFSGRMSFRYDLPPDTADQSYPIDLFFDDWVEFKNRYIAESQFSKAELKNELPRGISLDLVTAYTAGDVILNSTVRCTGAIFSGFVAAANWDIIDTNVVDPSITAAAVVNGVNTITIKKTGGTVDLATGEYVDIQGTVDDGTFDTDTSVTFRVTA